LCSHDSADPRPAFSSLIATSAVTPLWPFNNFDRVTRETPSHFAAAVTERSSGLQAILADDLARMGRVEHLHLQPALGSAVVLEIDVGRILAFDLEGEPVIS
jgi:hypothetical protein